RNPLFERNGTRAGVEDNAGQESASECVAQPHQVPRVVRARSSGGLDLDADHAPASELDDEVDLVPPALAAQMVEPRPLRGDRELRPKLSSNERVQDAPEHVAVTEDPIGVQTEQVREQRRLDNVAL